MSAKPIIPIDSATLDRLKGWPKPQPLEGALPEVEQFAPDALLPASFRGWVVDVAERMQVPIDLPAIASVLCLAGAVNRRARIQPKASDTSWLVVPNLWGALIAPPGYLKTPVISNCIAPLERIEKEWRKQDEDAHPGVPFGSSRGLLAALLRPIRSRHGSYFDLPCINRNWLASIRRSNPNTPSRARASL
jgi:hypothetical protein